MVIFDSRARGTGGGGRGRPGLYVVERSHIWTTFLSVFGEATDGADTRTVVIFCLPNRLFSKLTVCVLLYHPALVSPSL